MKGAPIHVIVKEERSKKQEKRSRIWIELKIKRKEKEDDKSEKKRRKKHKTRHGSPFSFSKYCLKSLSSYLPLFHLKSYLFYPLCYLAEISCI